MKCAICKNKTTWNTSYGHREFIVCPSCHDAIWKTLEKYCPTDTVLPVMSVIFTLGDRAGEEKNLKNT